VFYFRTEAGALMLVPDINKLLGLIH